MGGNALKEFGVERLNREEYDGVVQYHKTLLDHLGFKYHVVQCYGNKDSFGDLDILMSKGENGKAMQDWLNILDECGEIYKRNTNVLSVLFPCGDKKFQVDYIFEKENNFDFAKHYFDYNDLGNLIGRVAHKAGFKFGHDGLWYVMRDGDYQVGKICLTKDFEKAIHFLGFSPYRYSYGFKTLEEIFEFVVENPFFDSESYNLDNRSRYARIRDKKRPTYQKFLKWVEENKKCGIASYTKEEWLKFARNCFPNFSKEYYLLQEENIMRKAAKVKFNGGMVMELTGLKDKELGSFMKHFRELHEDFRAWVLQTPELEIQETVLTSFKGWVKGA